MKWRIKRLFYRIKRVIDFIPIIWKGFDWDYNYAIDLFKFQLERTAGYIYEKGNAINNKDTAAKIRTAVRLMSKVYNEDYTIEHYDELEKLYGKSHFAFIELEDKDEKGDPYYEMKTWNELAVDEKHQKEIDEVRRQMFLKGKDKQKRAHKILWDFIEHNIQNWWD